MSIASAIRSPGGLVTSPKSLRRRNLLPLVSTSWRLEQGLRPFSHGLFDAAFETSGLAPADVAQALANQRLGQHGGRRAVTEDVIGLWLPSARRRSSRTILQPISLAMDTPSLVIVGHPTFPGRRCGLSPLYRIGEGGPTSARGRDGPSSQLSCHCEVIRIGMKRGHWATATPLLTLAGRARDGRPAVLTATRRDDGLASLSRPSTHRSRANVILALAYAECKKPRTGSRPRSTVSSALRSGVSGVRPMTANDNTSVNGRPQTSDQSGRVVVTGANIISATTPPPCLPTAVHT